MNTKNSRNLFKSIATLVGIASVSACFSLPVKAQVNPNPSIFEEYSHNQGNLAQTTPGVGQDRDTSPGTTTPGVTQPDTTTPGVTQPVQDTTTPGTNQQNNGNGVRALW